MFRTRSPPLALCVAEQLLVVLVVGFVVLWPRHVEFIVRIVVVVKATECRQRGSRGTGDCRSSWHHSGTKVLLQTSAQLTSSAAIVKPQQSASARDCMWTCSTGKWRS
jgi:hypothetical protein